MSSRNVYLSAQDRKDALSLIESFKLAKKMIKEGERNPRKVVAKQEYVTIGELRNCPRIGGESERRGPEDRVQTVVRTDKPSGLDVSVHEAIPVGGAAVGHLPRIVSRARVGRVVNV